MATKAKVAFHTIPVTVQTSDGVTTFARRAMAAPMVADHPMDSPLGCQITKIIVSKNTATAEIAMLFIKIPPIAYAFSLSWINSKLFRLIALVVQSYLTDQEALLNFLS
jgi:hypothetical protein